MLWNKSHVETCCLFSELTEINCPAGKTFLSFITKIRLGFDVRLWLWKVSFSVSEKTERGPCVTWIRIQNKTHEVFDTGPFYRQPHVKTFPQSAWLHNNCILLVYIGLSQQHGGPVIIINHVIHLFILMLTSSIFSLNEQMFHHISARLPAVCGSLSPKGEFVASDSSHRSERRKMLKRVW